ncbi:multicopper oxidase family protein [Paenibacillus sp. UMB4589-SE434]|uniref:multicopper oxidase family protein n=1 Tax=Paenibacillus sp. UMB4589-SE434 TaxID=3046314 RepID=UPI00254D1045|nr:multicopper oxidase family protein [Paenibacillus sp. UMB4589-SE434]MDK8180496.1 multicopper oxidase family protein [Paenibacillus sp. UMB4589-SE434]
MTKRTLLRWTTIIILTTLLVSGCSTNDEAQQMNQMDHSKMNHGSTQERGRQGGMPKPGTEPDKGSLAKAPQRVDGTQVILTAQPANLRATAGITLPVWTFNGSIPGPEIRVKVGETVKVTLKNELQQPVSIHWHGYPVPNEMDGIPGVTQDAVVPGASFVYEFKATVPGTYWYHSHQDSVNQVDKGLYGAIVVEDVRKSYDRDYTLVLDEWMSMVNGNINNQPHSAENSAGNETAHSSMTHGETNDKSESAEHDMSMYDLYTINGKSGASIPQLQVKHGEKIRIRLINAGYLSHRIHLHGHEFKVVATDGQAINSPAVVKDQVIAIAPGERYDIEFVADNPGNWLLEAHGINKAVIGMRAVIHYTNDNSPISASNTAADLPLLDLVQYGATANNVFSLETTFDQHVQMDLDTKVVNGSTVYTINGNTFPNTDKIRVKKGDKVQVTFVNKSKSDDHPMHLHGHFFQILSKNGTVVQGSPLIKDTLNVKPGERYVIAFEADNPGDWMFHCHDLHHAAAGMITDVHYPEHKKTYVPDPKVGNKAE